MTSNLYYYLGFSFAPGIGPTRFDMLLQYFNSVQDAFLAPPERLQNILGARVAQRFVSFRATFDFEKERSQIEEQHITILTREDPRYPQALRELTDAPICLYVKGNISEFEWENMFLFAIVGTRKPTQYGIQVTKKFSRELAESGAVIVSGMAMGVDGLAHTEAIKAGKRTIAFLGCGVNIVYPIEHHELYHHIINSGGLVISEFPPNQMTSRGHFIARNRLISGISKGVLVAEGLIDSGSLITARYALSQGKEVFAPPAPITSELSKAPNLLLKEGAKMVTDVNDILEEFSSEMAGRNPTRISYELQEEERRLYQLLAQEAFSADELARTLHMPVFKILSLLSSMEIGGIIEKNSIGKYQIRF